MDSILKLWHFNIYSTISECDTVKLNNLIRLKFLFYNNLFLSLPYLLSNIKYPNSMEFLILSLLLMTYCKRPHQVYESFNAFWVIQKFPHLYAPVSFANLLLY